MYTCEHCKDAPSGKYQRRYQWKTEKGFREHRCYLADLEYAAKLRAEEGKWYAREAEKLRARQEAATYKPGDKAWAVIAAVSEPTHESGRKVRYEETRNYYVRRIEIHSATLGGYLVTGGFGYIVGDRDIFTSEAEAEQAAQERQRQYDEYCKLASELR